jgi:MFS family permease
MEGIYNNPEHRLLGAHAVGAVGDGTLNVTLAAYAIKSLGLGEARLGIILSVAWAVAFVCSSFLGSLADAVGLRRAAVAGALVVTVAASGLTLVHSPLGIGAVLVVYAIAQTSLTGVRQALVMSLIPAPHAVAMRGRIQVAMNAGMGAGAALAGVTLAFLPPAAWVANFAVDALAFVGAASLFATLPHIPRRGRASVADNLPSLRRIGVPSRKLASAAGLQSVLLLYMPMLTTGLPLAALHAHAPAWTIALLFVLNTGGVIAVQGRAAARVTDDRSAADSLRRGGKGLLISCIFVAASAAWWQAAPVLLLGAVIMQVLAEVRISAGTWHVGFALADRERPGYSHGVLSSAFPLARSAGPLVFTSLVVAAGPVGWIGLGIAFSAAGSAYSVLADEPPSAQPREKVTRGPAGLRVSPHGAATIRGMH